MADHASWHELDAVPLAPSRARRMLADLLDGSPADRGSARDDAMIVVSELVTNALLHGHPPIRIAFDVSAACIRIEVADGAAGSSPLVRPAPPDDPGGRGMLLVSELVDRWGYDEADGIKVVWAELDLP